MSDEALDARARRAVLANFTRDGEFVRVDKAAISRYVEGGSRVREYLQRLNEQLRPHQLHFGYRVFDEIVSFLICAENNQLYSDIDEAFDAAVLMKVLPKFHGSRAKLERPLRRVLAWCLAPDSPHHESIAQALEGHKDSDGAIRALSDLPYRCVRTAAKVRRMLQQLHTSGFASFS